MEESVRQLVRERAGDRCEYYRLRQREASSVRFHVEHVRSRQHGGTDEAANLALACPNCNWHKGPNLSAIDPETDLVVPLFNPRIDNWRTHFEVVGLEIVGRSELGRATVRLLRMNAPEQVDVRREIDARGELKFGE